MLFTEPAFLFGFLPLVLGLYYAAPPGSRNLLLVIASLIFYVRDGGAFTAVMVASIAVNTTAAVWIGRWRGTAAGRRLLGAAVGLNLLSLATFKYSGFLVENVNVLLERGGAAPLSAPGLLLPIGISFFTFHSISYLVDVHRGHAVAQKGPIGSALYLLFFPQLIAGPIIRYHDIAPQIAARAHSSSQFALGVRRFTIGLAKKLLVAGVLARPADAVFAMPPAEVTAGHAWLAVICYTLQIYFDFSGYTDMAIGLGHMFGFSFPENFRHPYTATSVQDFWTRWHISLSTWFRDYLYIPLGGSRRTPGRVYANLVTVFFLCGLWHGASWTFVVWGLLHGAFLVVERLGLGAWLAARPPAIGRVYTLGVVMLAWVFFRSDSLSRAGQMLAALAGFVGTAPAALPPAWYLTPEVLLALAAGAIGATPLVARVARRAAGTAGRQPGAGPATPADGLLPGRWAALTVGLIVALLGAALTQVAHGAFSPFIYFRF